MGAGEDTEESSDRSRLAKYLGRKVKLARTQDVGARIEAVAVELPQRRHTSAELAAELVAKLLECSE